MEEDLYLFVWMLKDLLDEPRLWGSYRFRRARAAILSTPQPSSRRDHLEVPLGGRPGPTTTVRKTGRAIENVTLNDVALIPATPGLLRLVVDGRLRVPARTVTAVSDPPGLIPLGETR